MVAKDACQKDIENLGERLSICRDVQNYHYGMREFDESAKWRTICKRIESRLKSTFVKCERK